MWRAVILGFLVLSFLASSGCGGDEGPVTVPVKGTVFLDDKPAEGVEVRFYTEKHTGYGVTDREGKFVLAQGASPGENKIAFLVRAAPGDVMLNPDEGMDEGQLEAAGGIGNVTPPTTSSGLQLHADYGDMEKSRITFNVPESGTESADFHLRAAGP